MKSDDFKNDGLHQPITKESFSKPKYTLSRERSVELWLKGKDEWNLWMKNHPDTYVDFNHVNFTPDSLASVAPDEDLAIHGKHHRYLKTISFKGYIFNGGADFTGATFPSPTHFDDARFEGSTEFSGVVFGSDAGFSNTIFNSNANFSNVEFQGTVVFDDTHFASTTLFTSATFECMAYFPCATFNLATDFSHAEFDGGTHFKGARFYCELVNFNDIKSTDTFNFDDAITDQIQKLSFKGSTFDKDFIIDGNFNCIPDLRGTKLNHHTELSDLKCNLKREKAIPFTPFLKVVDKLDAEKLCRLKELAEQNKNHDKALMFHADEMRAKRWTKLNTAQSILDLLYSATSNYGQSIMRPLLWLFLSFILFSSYLVGKSELEMIEALSPAATTSIATMTPFISVSKDARQFGMEQLFKTDIPTNYYLWSYAHASASFVFIFLIGLGLRNRFRI